jgi:hypothetical protein
MEQLAFMMEIKGIPPNNILEQSTRRKIFFDSAWNPILAPNSRGKVRKPKSKTLANVLKCSDMNFISFLEVKLLFLKHN